MELTQININSNPALCRRAKRLYRSAFPRAERLPWWLLRLQAKRKGIGLTAWMDGETFCGFTSWVTVEDMHFVLFLAVEETHRSRGCGSAILSELSRKYGTVVLNIETLDRDAPNLPERERRLRFYRSNGFRDTGWFVWEVGGRFRVLSTNSQPDMELYRKIFRYLTFGIWNVKLLRDPEGPWYDNALP